MGWQRHDDGMAGDTMTVCFLFPSFLIYSSTNYLQVDYMYVDAASLPPPSALLDT
jgi:hypothetical protein